MQFSALLAGAGIALDSLEGDADIASVTADSRAALEGSLFICMPSPTGDSHRFIPDAVSNGAVAVLVHSDEGFKQARQLGVAAALIHNEGQRFPEAVWRLCRAFYRNPSRSMKVLAVTGTNGKTTTAWLIRDMLLKLGVSAGYLGTLGFQIPGETRDLANTTPFSPELFAMLAEARDHGVEAMAMEVSSHALDQRRVDGVEFDAAVFTNLTQDHLDYHGSMVEYSEAKYRLFHELGPRSGKNFRPAINIDDPVGREWARKLGPNVLTYGEGNGDLVADPVSVTFERIVLKLRFGTEQETVSAPLGGTFNVQNCVSAAAGMICLGYGLLDIVRSLPAVRPVPGRFEPVPNDKGIGVIVDYAHTPDALEKLLDSVRMLHPSRVLTVFGCGGDRDRAKRPKMARAASERSDVVVLTSDNPRTEDPVEILKEVEKGLVPGPEAMCIVDRREAIARSLQEAKPGDVVVIAGKGHENYQIIGRQKLPMDDREIAREALSH